MKMRRDARRVASRGRLASHLRYPSRLGEGGPRLGEGGPGAGRRTTATSSPHSPSPHNSQAVPRRPGLVCGREARLLRRGQDALGPAQVDVGRVAQALPLRRPQHEKIP